MANRVIIDSFKVKTNSVSGRPESDAARYQRRTSAEPQAKPPPKASSRTSWPGLMRPSRPFIEAMGTEAAEVLP